MPSFFRPAALGALREYDTNMLRSDLVAGVTVGVVAIPLAMAFAIASGVPPEAGLITAVVAGFLISALGGSRVQIGGPTGAFVVLVYTILRGYGLDKLIICTVMAGVILIVMSLLKLGSVIEFIPMPVTTGFTSGIAVVIASTQFKDFFGLQVESMPPSFMRKLAVLYQHLGSISWPTLLLSVGCVLVIAFWPRSWAKYAPGSILAMIAGTLVAQIWRLPVATIGSTFGAIPHGLPRPHFTVFDLAMLPSLFAPALTIALLAAIESLLSAVAADSMTGDRHDSNQELFAQGIANIFSPLFGGIPATGAIARTATNIRNGGKTPVAGMVHALTLLGIMIVAAPLVSYVPLATLAAVLMVVSFHMVEWHELNRLHLLPRSDATVFLTVFLLTILMDLTRAVEIGMVLAAVLFIKRVADNTSVGPVDHGSETEGLHHSLHGKLVPDSVVVVRVFGAFLFGATKKLDELRTHEEKKILILRMRKVMAMDATGLRALERLHGQLRMEGKYLVLSAPQPQPLRVLERSGFVDKLGRDNLAANLDQALKRAAEILREIQQEHALAVASSSS